MTKGFKKALAFCLATVFAVLSVSTAQADEPKEVFVEKTAAHRKLFSVPVYLVPANGLSLAKTAGGCMDKAKKVSFEASQLRIEYNKLLEEFNEDGLKKAGLELKLKSEFIWNGRSAMLLKAFHRGKSSVVGKWILIIDRGGDTWMLNGLYDAKDQKRSEIVLNMLKSACWDEEEDTALSPARAIPLGNISADNTPFKLAGLMDGAFVYTKDGNLPTRTEDGALFVVSRLMNTYVASDKQKSFAKEKLEQIEKGRKLDVISEGDIVIDGLSGVELVAYAGEEPHTLIYQTMLFDYKNSHVMVGIAKGNTADNLEFFHNLAGTYRQER